MGVLEGREAQGQGMWVCVEGKGMWGSLKRGRGMLFQLPGWGVLGLGDVQSKLPFDSPPKMCSMGSMGPVSPWVSPG